MDRNTLWELKAVIVDILFPIILGVVVCFAIFNVRACEIRRLETVTEQVKICKEAGGLYQTNGNCVKNPGIGQ